MEFNLVDENLKKLIETDKLYKRVAKNEDYHCDCCGKSVKEGFIGEKWDDDYYDVVICKECLEKIVKMLNEVIK